MYRSSVPTYDEGWTRWIFDSKTFRHGVLTDKELARRHHRVQAKAGRHGQVLRDHLIPINRRVRCSKVIAQAQCHRNSPAVLDRRRQAFARICRDWRHARLSESRFELRDRTVQTAAAQRRRWFAAHGFLRAGIDPAHRARHDASDRRGMPKETIAWAEDSPVFEVTNDPNASVPASNVRIIASYPPTKIRCCPAGYSAVIESKARPRWLKSRWAKGA